MVQIMRQRINQFKGCAISVRSRRPGGNVQIFHAVYLSSQFVKQPHHISVAAESEIESADYTAHFRKHLFKLQGSFARMR
jgi:hypothetical protein